VETEVLAPDSYDRISLDDVVRGKVAVLTGCLQHAGLFDDVVAATLDVVEDVGGIAARAAVERDGFEKLHHHMGMEEAIKVRPRLADRLSDDVVGLVSPILAGLGRSARSPYICGQVYVRIIMPEDIVAGYRSRLRGEAGFLVPHSPHRDSWFSQGTNSINLWMAVGRVSAGNSLLVYPDVYHTDQGRSGNLVHPGEPLGRPVRYELSPGDVLLFHGDHVHSSEVNITEDTRYVITARVSVGAPKYNNKEGSSWVPYYHWGLAESRLRAVSSMRSRATVAYLRRRVLSRLSSTLSRGSSTLSRGK